MADVDKVKGGVGLGEADGKVAEIAAAAEEAGDAGHVGDDLGDDLCILALVGPLAGDGGTESVGGLFTALEPLSYPSFLKLSACALEAFPSNR